MPPHVQKYTSTKSCEMMLQSQIVWIKLCAVAKWQIVKWEDSCGKPHADGMPQMCFFAKKNSAARRSQHNSTPSSMGRKVSRNFLEAWPQECIMGSVVRGAGKATTNLLWSQLFAVSEDCNPRVSFSPQSDSLSRMLWLCAKKIRPTGRVLVACETVRDKQSHSKTSPSWPFSTGYLRDQARSIDGPLKKDHLTVNWSQIARL